MKYLYHAKDLLQQISLHGIGIYRSTAKWLPVLALIAGTGVCPDAALSQDREDERLAMVTSQLEARDISDRQVLEAMRQVPRHLFVPERYRQYAYQDRPLAIGEDQTISQPYIVALMTQILEVDSTDRVLEVGTGSGYQAAVLAEIVETVKTVEIVESLAVSARQRLSSLGYNNVEVKHGDGYNGWKEYAPYDAIVVTAAPEAIPPPLIEQLKDGGRMVIPVGEVTGTQKLQVVTKQEGEIATRDIIPVRFVPLTRDN
jgi:protein-L-isoaspartate(D-aspartate) O-methyltransferase